MYSQFCIQMLGVNPVNEETGNGETQLGFVRTPDSLVDFMISQTLSGISDINLKRILIPGCGDGQFIRGIIRYCNSHNSKLPEIVGIEIDQERAEVCQEELGDVASIVSDDFLSMNIELFDIIIGNPPYVAITGISQTDKDRYRNNFKTAIERFDLYFLFWEKAISLLREGGKLTFVTPEKFLYVSSASKLRNVLSANHITRIILVDSNSFTGVAAYPCVTILDKIPNDKQGTLITRRDGTDFMITLSPDQDSWIEVIEDSYIIEGNTVPLQGLCKRISCGPATGRDSLFVWPIEEIPDSLAEISFSTISGRQLLPGSDDFTITENMIVPYQRETGQPFDPESGTISNLESVFEKLDPEGMRIKKEKGTKPWFKFKDNIPFQELLGQKILVKDICAYPEFWIDTQGVIPRHTVYYIVPKEEIQIHVLLEYLKSERAIKWLQSNCQKAQNGHLRIQSNTLKRLPIPSNIVNTPSNNLMKGSGD